MIRVLVYGFILIVNRVLFVIGRAIGMVLGGIIAGFTRGIRDLNDMQKWMKYQHHMAKKRIEEQDEDER